MCKTMVILKVRENLYKKYNKFRNWKILIQIFKIVKLIRFFYSRVAQAKWGFTRAS